MKKIESGKTKTDFIRPHFPGVQERRAQYYNFPCELIISCEHHIGTKQRVYLRRGYHLPRILRNVRKKSYKNK